MKASLFALATLCGSLLLAQIGCSSMPASGSATPTASGSATPNTTPNCDSLPAGLNVLQSQIFTPDCASCHNAQNGSGTGVDLSSASAVLATTSSVTASQTFGGAAVELVDPGKHALSYLWLKVTGASGISGHQMPEGGTALNVCQSDAIAAWIDAGAQADTSPTPTPSATPSPSPTGCAIAAKLSALQTGLFTPACSGCHFSGNSTGVDLDSTSDSFSTTVGITAGETFGGSSVQLVDPGAHATSYVWLKVTGASGISGSSMPEGGTLDSCQISALSAWIDAGALND